MTKLDQYVGYMAGTNNCPFYEILRSRYEIALTPSETGLWSTKDEFVWLDRKIVEMIQNAET